MDCHIMGDSIAVGVRQEMRECSVKAVAGASAAGATNMVRDADILIVSVGSNHPRDPALRDHLEAIRSRATGRVIWISPADHVAARMVREVAAAFGDAIVTFETNLDRVHPRSYKALARDVRKAMK